MYANYTIGFLLLLLVYISYLLIENDKKLKKLRKDMQFMSTDCRDDCE